MKILCYADPHWSTYSSIVRGRGEKFSKRLENLINTMNWIEDTAMINGCDMVVCLGDFFDTAKLDCEEITALNYVHISLLLEHLFIVGNHEINRKDITISSSHIFNLNENSVTVDKVAFNRVDDHTGILYLPYILESDRKPLSEYIKFDVENLIIFSHNDIKGIEMGRYVSQEGFSIEEIEENCRLFINGHLHNCSTFGDKIINLGNITGQNFSEDATKYPHRCMILDTEDFSIEYIENPHAYNFYKFDFGMTTKENIYNKLNSVKPHAVVAVKTHSANRDFVYDTVQNNPNIEECRITMSLSYDKENDALQVKLPTTGIDHLQKFQQFIYDNMGMSESVLSELSKIGGVTDED